MVVKIAVGPSAPPMIPRDPASFGVNPIKIATSKHREDSELGGGAEDGQAKVAEHRAEVGQTHRHP